MLPNKKAAGNKINEFNSTSLEQPSQNVIVEDIVMQDDMPDMDNTGNEPVVVPALFEDQTTVNPLIEEEPIEKAAQELGEELANTSADKTIIDVNAVEPEGDAAVPPTVDEVTSNAVVEKQIKTKRRRKLIIDEVKEIDSATMKTQLSDTSSIMGQLELAPPTRRLMQLKETSGVDKMFSSTSRPLHNKTLLKASY